MTFVKTTEERTRGLEGSPETSSTYNGQYPKQLRLVQKMLQTCKIRKLFNEIRDGMSKM
jgi:hypothetical protein